VIPYSPSLVLSSHGHGRLSENPTFYTVAKNEITIPLLSVLGLSSAELPNVELELTTLEDVTIGTTRLSRSGSDGGVETTGRELGLEEGVDLGFLLTFGDGSLDVSGLLVGILGDSGESLLGLSDCRVGENEEMEREIERIENLAKSGEGGEDRFVELRLEGGEESSVACGEGTSQRIDK
jgi:hypothetical protein